MFAKNVKKKKLHEHYFDHLYKKFESLVIKF